MGYKKLLEDGYASEKTWREVNSRLEFLADGIFDFTTYDLEMAELFATKAIEVCRAISGRTTFEYIKDHENYKWYLVMCNMPFFAGRIEWGTSVRGAWWRDSVYYSASLYDGDKQLLDPIEFSREEWEEFINAILEFAELP